MYKTSLILAHLALWVVGSQAFFPYNPDHRHHHVGRRDGGLDQTEGLPGFVSFKISKPIRRHDEHDTSAVLHSARGLAKKYGQELRLRSGLSSALGARDNSHKVDPAQTPTLTKAAGIDQDGTDTSYFVKVKLGSNGQIMYMLLDTGARNTWVMGSDCKTDACSKHNLFNPDQSKTSKDGDSTFSVQYGSGSVEGLLVTDSIQLNDMIVKMQFGVAKNTSNDFNQFAFDGIMGLAMDGDSPTTFVEALSNAGTIDKKLFGVSLARASEGMNDGEISFGVVDESKFSGDISYSKVDEDSKGVWAIPIDDVSVNGKSARTKAKLAYIDTGTTYAFGSPSDVKAMYSAIDGATSKDGTTWQIPCDFEGTIGFVFSGQSYNVSAKDLVAKKGDSCTGKIYGMEVVEGAWLIGDLFLKNVYTVFDIDNSRIGFATKQTNSTSTSTTDKPGSTSSDSAGTDGATASSTSSSVGNPTGINILTFTAFSLLVMASFL